MFKFNKLSVEGKTLPSIQDGKLSCKKKKTLNLDISYCKCVNPENTSHGWHRCGSRLIRNEAITILNLPEESIAMILSFLNYKDRCNASQTCRLFSLAARWPHLWKNVCVNYSFLNLQVKFPNFVTNSKDKENSRSDKLRKKHIQHLQYHNARIRHLHYELYVNQYHSTLHKLMVLKHCCHLESFRVIIYDIDYTQKAFEQRLIFVQELLDRLYLVSPGLTELFLHSCQILAKSDTIDKVLRFRNLVHLQLHIFVTPKAHLHSNDIENILKSLKKLQSLDFEVDSYLDYNVPQPIYVKLVSTSLKKFRVYCSSNFLISSLEMPHLHTFLIEYWSNYTLSNTIPVLYPCLFEGVLKGCPSILVINNVNITGKKLEYQIDPSKVKALKLCHCSQHGVDNPILGDEEYFNFNRRNSLPRIILDDFNNI